MLPTETAADILTFLQFFDLSGALLTTKKLSDISHTCSKRLKRWMFCVVRLRSYVSIFKGHTQIAFWHADDTERAYETVTCPIDRMSELLVAAFRNVFVDSMDVSCCSCPQRGECLMDAVRMMPPKSVAARELTLRAPCIRGINELFEMVDRFRGVQTLVLEVDVDAGSMNKTELLARCRTRGIEKLLYGHLELLVNS